MTVQSTNPGDLLEQAMNPFFTPDEFPPAMTVRCSSIASDVRYWYFHLTQAPREPQKWTPKQSRTLRNGTDVHNRTQAVLHRLAQAGGTPHVQIDKVEGYDDTSASLQVYPGVTLSGHADGLVTVDGVPYVLEIKSINGGDWRHLKRPMRGHQWQAMGYHLLFHRPTLFLYESKDTQLYKWFTYTPSEMDLMLINTKLHQLSEALATQTPPPFCEQETEPDFPNYIIKACAYCPFQAHCGKVPG